MIRATAAVLVLASSVPALAQSAALTSGATVYIQPKNGYETYLAAALDKKHVPLIVVDDPGKAEYLIRATLHHEVPNQAALVVNSSASATVNDGDDSSASTFNSGFNAGQQAAERKAERKAALGYSTASIAVVNVKTDQIVFAYSATKNGEKQMQKTAEDFAAHLKKAMEKSEKRRK